MSATLVEGAGDDQELAHRIARRVLDVWVTTALTPAQLLPRLVSALQAEQVGGDPRARARIARDIALLWQLLGPGGLDPVAGLTRHVSFTLARPVGNPLWEDLRRLSTLLDDLGRTLRAQRRRARVLPGARAAARGTEQVMATAMGAFATTWRPPSDQ